MQVPAAGGTPKTLLKADPAKGERFLTPQFLPDGKTILLTVKTSSNWQEARIAVLQPGIGVPRTLIQGGADARYVPTGHLVYLKEATLMAIPFDPVKVQLAGPPVAMLDGVMQAVNEPNSDFETGMGQFAISASGNLVYASGGIYPPRLETLVSVDRKGVQTEMSPPKAAYLAPRISPDGQKLVLFKFFPTSLQSDVWVLDLSRGTFTRLTSQGVGQWPIWSPDGKRVFFSNRDSRAPGIFSVPADGSGAIEPVVTGQNLTPALWSSDGKRLAYIDLSDSRHQIWTRPVSGGGEAQPFLATSQFNYFDAEFSPDGRWMTYVSNESGASEVYVQAFPGPGDRHAISGGGGGNPMWSPNGRELFYSVGTPGQGKQKFMAVDITPGESFKSGAPHVLFEGIWTVTTPLRSYDVMPDGQHFIMERPEYIPDQKVTKLNVVLNWFDELRKRAPRSSN